jgi:SAM-dependent methyltransferase
VAGRDAFEDAVLYDWEYRRRRDDVRFYCTLADERGGPILDLGCGTGRVMLPLVRAGHVVVGLDRAPAMLARAAARLARLTPRARRRALLLRADLRRLPIARGRFRFALAAFHTIQHLATDRELRAFFAAAARALAPGGWLAFDTFAPNARFLARAAGARRWARTRFRHPRTGRATEYSESYRLDRKARLLTTTFHYRPAASRRGGAGRRVDLVHRLLEPAELRPLLAGTGLTLIATWGGFDARPLAAPTEQHVFLLRRGTLHHGRQKIGPRT